MMTTQLKVVYWRGENHWLGKLLDHPEIMTQGDTIEELDENIRDAYRELLLDGVPSDYEIREIPLEASAH